MNPESSPATVEWFPLLDEHDRVVGRARREACHGNPSLRHPVVHGRITDGRGAWLLQKRAMAKDIQPGRWDMSVGGHVRHGESVAAAIIREIAEEVGVLAYFPSDAAGCPATPGIVYPEGDGDVDFDGGPCPAEPPPSSFDGPDGEGGSMPRMALRFAFAYDYVNATEHERVFAFEGVCGGPFRPQADEVDALRFWTPEALRDPLRADELTPQLRGEMNRWASYDARI